MVFDAVGDFPEPSVAFQNGINGTGGIKGTMTILADVYASPSQEVNFLQIVDDLENGANGHTPGTDAGIQLELQGGALLNKAYRTPPFIHFPLLDGDPQGESLNQPPVEPLYGVDGMINSPNNPGSKIYSMGDSPGPVFQVNGEKVALVDIKYTFTTHVVIRYADKSIYPLGYLTWTLNIYAHQYTSGVGLTAIDGKSKITQTPFVWTNVTPITMLISFFNRTVKLENI